MAQTCTTENLTTETPENIKKKLFDSVMKQEWEKVATIYKENPSARTIKIKSSGETALHLAISDPKYENNIKNVKELVRHIKKPLEMLNLKTEKDETPLHSAAANSRGGKLCQLLIESVGDVKNKNVLELVRNRCQKGETPLFQAVHYGRLGSFFYLHSIIREHFGEKFSNFERNDGQSIIDDPIIRSILVRNDDRSILHEAIIREHFYLAFYIIQLYKGLVNLVDQQGDSPLHALAKKAAAFKSGSSLPWWDKLIYKCIPVEKLKPLESHGKSDEEKKTMDNGVEKECTNIDIKSGEGSNIPSEIREHLKRSRGTCRIWYYFVIFGYGRKAVDKICKEKRKHTWAKQVLDELLKRSTMYDENTTAQSQSSREEPSSSSGTNEGGKDVSQSSREEPSSSSGTNAGGKDVSQSSREEPSSSSGTNAGH